MGKLWQHAGRRLSGREGDLGFRVRVTVWVVGDGVSYHHSLILSTAFIAEGLNIVAAGTEVFGFVRLPRGFW